MPSHKHIISGNWFQQTFDALYPILYAHRTIEAAEAESIFSIEQTNIQQNDRVLDLCCGGGRHIAHLRNVSDHVVGLDYSSHLLEIARETVGNEQPLIRGDMRHLPFVDHFDVLVNYFTSFGYFRDAEENEKVVRDMTLALKSGGRFFIDYMCKDWAIANLEEETRRSAEGFQVYERRWIEADGSRINKSTSISRGDDEIKHTGESVQLYTTDEFSTLLTNGGLIIDNLYGNYAGSPCAPEFPRMIAVGRRA
ncbi:MAG: class I SAM-dependent methyltransferase [Candidatus Hydrogenedentota bacterium]